MGQMSPVITPIMSQQNIFENLHFFLLSVFHSQAFPKFHLREHERSSNPLSTLSAMTTKNSKQQIYVQIALWVSLKNKKQKTKHHNGPFLYQIWFL